MSDIAIKVENISKKYQIGENKTYPTLRDKLMEIPSRIFKGPKKNKEFWALRDVSFEVKKGEVVGIIGRNGAGKSTMLKILARITEPTSGKITMYGRVASMLEVGTGFNPELTGRENIFLNGAIIGMKKTEIKSKFDDIVEFSGVGKFLDTPVKHYSSGMYVRLAFAVAAHLDADILLVDEVLAVGDAEFQKKCLGKMSDLASSGRTVIFVSHDTRAISTLCKKAILLIGGNVDSCSETSIVLEKYFSIGVSNNSDSNLFTRSDSNNNIIKSILVTSSAGSNQIKYGESVDLKISTFSRNKQYSVEIIIRNQKLEPIVYVTNMINSDLEFYDAGDTIIVHIPRLNLAKGKYWIDVNCRIYPNTHVDRVSEFSYITVLNARPKNIKHDISSDEGLGSYIIDDAIFTKE